MGLGNPPVWDQMTDPSVRMARANKTITEFEGQWLDNAMRRVATAAKPLTARYTVDMQTRELQTLDDKSKELVAAQAACVARRDGGLFP